MGDLNNDQLSVTRNAPTDLDWDYSAHEASPLLREPVRAVNSNLRPSKNLSKRQLNYLIENIEEVKRILKTQIAAYSPTPSLHKFIKLKKFFFVIPIIFSILHVSTVVIDSFFTFQHFSFTYISTSINTILLLIYQGNVVVGVRHNLSPLPHLTISLTLLTFLFASLYAIVDVNKNTTAFWPIYFRSMHSSISVATLNYYGQISQDNFWALLLLNLQMVISLTHILFITASVIRWMGRRDSDDDDDDSDDGDDGIADGDDNVDGDTGSYQASFGRESQ